jgi:hypothetical protein
MAQRRRILRFSGFILLGLLFLWLPLEDNSFLYVHLLAIGTVLWASVNLVSRIRPGARKNVIIYPLSGIIAGVGVTLLVIFLMIFKNGIHGHPTPDFTGNDLVRVFSRSHIWVIAGLIIGSGLSLLQISTRNEDG